MKLGAKRGELVQLMQEFVPRSHVVIFRKYMKLGAKRCELVQLMQKFVPQSQIVIYRNKHTRSTPLDPKFMFSGIA